MLRNIKTMATPNDGSRSLEASIMSPEVIKAFEDWKTATSNSSFVLIGGMAFSFHARSRFTQDIDVLFLNEHEVPKEVEGFKKIRSHAFEHKRTGVEVEALTPGFLGVSVPLVKQVLETAKTVDGVKIASREGLIALKLVRFSRRDAGDIEDLLEGVTVTTQYLSGWTLNDTQIKNFSQFINS